MAGHIAGHIDRIALKRHRIAGTAAAVLLCCAGYCAAQTENEAVPDRVRDLVRPKAQIVQRIEDQNARPRITFITPSTESLPHAFYYQLVRKRIEEIGTHNFPEIGGKKLYGDLIVHIPVYQDGSLHMKDGGPRVTRSSGNRLLDKAALRIVRSAAPFAPFYKGPVSQEHDDVWIVVAAFNFTKENARKNEAPGSTTGDRPDGQTPAVQ